MGRRKVKFKGKDRIGRVKRGDKEKRIGKTMPAKRFKGEKEETG